ncbi:transposase family protein [Leptolyngbya ohadii]|uniref:transposase family protein n=1 Tax=Leptolyngbya ohadii TaxID=1962290 RepID=UPI00117AC63F|nr:transposase family protein [Leptolyngbya ohadii]
MKSGETELELSNCMQAKFINQIWLISLTIFSSNLTEESPPNSRLILAIVSALYSKTIVGYRLTHEDEGEDNAVIAALLHAVCPKNYPSRYDSPDLWTTGGIPQFLLTDGGTELTSNSTSLARFAETQRIQLLRLKVGRHLSFTGSIERMLQGLSVNLLKHQSVSRLTDFP